MTTATRTKTAPHTLAVGDILYSSWGYSMTIVNWYQVIAVTPKMVTVAEIRSRIARTSCIAIASAARLGMPASNSTIAARSS